MMSYQHPKKRYLQQMLTAKKQDDCDTNAAKKTEPPVGNHPVSYSQLSDHLLYCENKSHCPTHTIPKIICLMKKQMTDSIDNNNCPAEPFTSARLGGEISLDAKRYWQKGQPDDRSTKRKPRFYSSSAPCPPQNPPTGLYGEPTVQPFCDDHPKPEPYRFLKDNSSEYRSMGALREPHAYRSGVEKKSKMDSSGNHPVNLAGAKDHIAPYHNLSDDIYCHQISKELKTDCKKQHDDTKYASDYKCTFPSTSVYQYTKHQAEGAGEGGKMPYSQQFPIINVGDVQVKEEKDMGDFDELPERKGSQGYVSVAHRPGEGVGILPSLWDHLKGPIPKLPQVLNTDGVKPPDYSGISQLLNMDLEENSWNEPANFEASDVNKCHSEDDFPSHPGMSDSANNEKRKKQSPSKNKETAQHTITMLGKEAYHVTSSGRNKGSGKESLPKHDCQICGDIAGGFHCGAFVCEACKKFYLRCLKSKSNVCFTCPKQKKCTVAKETRSHCQFCRFQKCVNLGMYKPGREDDKQLKVDFKSIPCKICEAPSSGFHFGAITCEGCKGFFRRMLKESIHRKFSCSGDGNCSITSANRTTCKACRFRKCGLVGMKLAGTRLGRQSNSMKRSTLMNYGFKSEENETETISQQTETVPSSGEGFEPEPGTETKTETTCDELDDDKLEHGHVPREGDMGSNGTHSPPKGLELDLCQTSSSSVASVESNQLLISSESEKSSSAADSAHDGIKSDRCMEPRYEKRVFNLDDAKKKILFERMSRQGNGQRGMMLRGDCDVSEPLLPLTSLLVHPQRAESTLTSESDSSTKHMSDPPMDLSSNNSGHSNEQNSSRGNSNANGLRKANTGIGATFVSPRRVQSEPEFLQSYCEGLSPDQDISNSETCRRLTPHDQPQPSFSRRYEPSMAPVKSCSSRSSEPTRRSMTCHDNEYTRYGSSWFLGPEERSQISHDKESVKLSSCSSSSQKSAEVEGHSQQPQTPDSVHGYLSINNKRHQYTKEPSFPGQETCDFKFQNLPSLQMMRYSDVSTDEEEARTWSILETDPLQWLGVLNQDDDAISRIHSRNKTSSAPVILKRKLLSNGEWLIITLCSAFKALDGIQNRPEKYVDLQNDYGMDRMNVAWSIFDRSFQHNAKYFLKFIKKIPGFRALPMADQVQLTKDALYPIILIYHSQFFNPADKTHRWFQNTQEEIDYFKCYLPQINALEHHFIYMGQIMNHMHVTPTERNLLAALYVFSGSEQQKLHAVKEIEEIKDYILNAFIIYLDRLEKPDPTRLGILLARLPELQRANIEMLLVAAQMSCMCPNIQFKQLWQELYHNAKSKEKATKQP